MVNILLGNSAWEDQERLQLSAECDYCSDIWVGLNHLGTQSPGLEPDSRTMSVTTMQKIIREDDQNCSLQQEGVVRTPDM
jgi:hypothetical protein